MLVVDTGPLVALGDRRDPDHQACLELLATEPGPLRTTGLVIAEATYLLARQVGVDAEVALFTDIAAGRFVVDELTPDECQRVGDLVDRYRDLPLGGTDASVVVLAERHRATRIATLDRRHFSVVRPAHTSAFELVP
ncbi:type II toxin-antitoxin system VapC family toxin [Rhabdothermincola sp.]|uniref:type II toxin-antitoxin system VapC family toxin n=1 Tax=Rhabdothermincola sp. TaxID=2820405 RepID=UPI002FE3BD6F